jgi:hypothetical protein
VVFTCTSSCPCSTPHPLEQHGPSPPRQQHERIGVVTAEHKQVIIAEPSLQRVCGSIFMAADLLVGDFQPA